MTTKWNAHRMKAEGAAALDAAIFASSSDVVRGLVIEFIRLQAGMKVLRKRGIAPEAIAIAAVDFIVGELLVPHAIPAVQEGHGDPAQPQGDEDPGYVSDPRGYRGLETDIGSDSGEESIGGDEHHSTVTAQPHTKGKGGGKGHSRPDRAALELWSRGLSAHSKYGGVSNLRYKGIEFRKVLLRCMLHAGLGTSPSKQRSERHHPTQLNQKASMECNEAYTQATCECHSAGPKSLEPRLQTFLAESQGAGLSRVNIVTGLGSHGGGGTVRQIVPGILQASHLVKRFELASNYSAVYVDIVN
jgi:hypothetical protein